MVQCLGQELQDYEILPKSLLWLQAKKGSIYKKSYKALPLQKLQQLSIIAQHLCPNFGAAAFSRTQIVFTKAQFYNYLNFSKPTFLFLFTLLLVAFCQSRGERPWQCDKALGPLPKAPTKKDKLTY